MRLGIKIKQACFSTFDFHYICGQLVLYLARVAMPEEANDC